MNRKFIGIDIDEKTIETAADRIEASILEVPKDACADQR
jgi:hypothetical protein